MSFCRRCAGTGWVTELRPGYSYGPDIRVSGRCYDCGGTGEKTFLIGGKVNTEGEKDELKGDDRGREGDAGGEGTG